MPHASPDRDRPRSTRHLLRLALGLLALAGGCTHVAPYQREHLAKRSMDTGEREMAEERFSSHVYEAREGAGGAGFTAGGGCGCN